MSHTLNHAVQDLAAALEHCSKPDLIQAAHLTYDVAGNMAIDAERRAIYRKLGVLLNKQLEKY